MKIFLIYFCIFVFLQSVQSLIVKVQEGYLRGEELTAVGNGKTYLSFKGIPYAKPPVGPLRFMAPEPASSWNGLRNAMQHGSICPQYNIYEQKILPGSEDCLFVNVYTRNLKPEKLMPVMVFIHGGAFKSDSGNTDLYGPDFLVTIGGVVLVTFNYRLEVLGNLQLDIPDVPGNAGMKDQVLLLKWVQKNINKFGGDPKNVTIFGQSAGGAAVGLHLLSPMSKGLFKRAISMSGVPLTDFATPFSIKKKAFTLGSQLGFHTGSSKKLLKFLQSAPVEKLLNVNTSSIISEKHYHEVSRVLYFIPTIEKNISNVEHFLTEDPLTAMKNGHVNDVDFMTGFTNVEYIKNLYENEKEWLNNYEQHSDLFLPFEVKLKIPPHQGIELADIIKYHFFRRQPLSVAPMLQFINEVLFSTPAHRFLKHLPNSDKKRYSYIFSCQSSRNINSNEASKKYEIAGAAHLDDLAYLFDPKKAGFPLDPQSDEYMLIVQTVLLFTNFAKYGNPTPKYMPVKWPKFDEKRQRYLEINRNLTVRALHKSQNDFWEGLIFKEANVEY